MKRRDELLVGLMLVIAIIVLAVGTIWLIRGGLSSGYPLYARFRWGGGAKQGQSVLLSGVNVGYIDDVVFEQSGTIVIKMSINKKFHIPAGTQATLDPNGFFGDVVVGLRPTRVTTLAIAAGDTVASGKPQPQLSDIIAKVDSMSGTLNDVTRSVQVELVQGGALTDLRKTLATSNKLVAQLSEIAATEGRQLAQVTGKLNRAVSALDSATIDSTVKNLRTTSANVTALTNNLANTTAHLDNVLAKVDTGGGSTGKLINDPALFNNVNMLLTRLDSLTADFKQHPKKYVRLSIF
jgi:phospholipid/cholesterol/gamma-HCH transport system substrate-binding protein